MIKTTQKIILQAICIFGFGLIFAEDSPKTLSLEVQEGEGSLLLSWEIPDTLTIFETRVFTKTANEDDFFGYTIVDAKQNRFLDLQCDERVRYFYYLEIEDVFGHIVSSDRNQPTFGTCLQKENMDEDLASNPKDFLTLFQEKEKQEIQTMFPLWDESKLEVFTRLLHLKSFYTYAWIETIPLDFFMKIENDFESIHSHLSQLNFIDLLQADKKELMNSFYLLSEEWDVYAKELEANLQIRLNELSDTFIENLNFIQNVSPIKIISYDQNGSSISLLVIHPQEVNWDEIYFLLGDTFIDVKRPEALLPGDILNIHIPETWTSVSLVHEGTLIQNMQFIPNQVQTNLTLSGEYFTDSIKDHWKVTLPPSSFRLNEIHFQGQKLNIEIYGQSDDFESYSLFINDSLLLDFSPGFLNQAVFADTSFVLTLQDSAIAWIRWKESNEQDENKTLEWFPLGIGVEKHVIRVPDGGAWEETDEISLGTSNEPNPIFESNILIPEVFILYQNYPNPFNGETQISFDLLEDASISLFIFDANGRIIQQFIEDQFMPSGNYHYSWKANGNPTGIYFFTIQASVNGLESTTLSRKMIYLK